MKRQKSPFCDSLAKEGSEMNQRVESNRAVKGKLVNALLKLMERGPCQKSL